MIVIRTCAIDVRRGVIVSCTAVILKHTYVIDGCTAVIVKHRGVIDGCRGEIGVYSPAIAVGGGAIVTAD
ncbi:MAG: hypothetical protein ACKO5P_07535, partial [Nodosilinea sp.]